MTAFGFTGTQRGMTDAQKAALRTYLANFTGCQWHHGDCVGADSQSHDIAEAAGLVVYLHPPTEKKKRAFRDVPAARCFPEKPYLDRNKDIVTVTAALIAAPAEPEEQLRSGTWSTVRFARKLGRPIVLILPDGTLK